MSGIMKKDDIYIISTEHDEEAGHVNFVDIDGERYIYHTETKPEFGGRGYASTLIKALLEDSAKAGLKVVAVCPFVSAWLEKNPGEIGVNWRMPEPGDSAKIREARRDQ